MSRRLVTAVLAVLALVFAMGARGAVQEQEIRVDKAKVAEWNHFVRDLLALSKKLVAARSVRKRETKGEYGGAASARYGYRRVDFVDVKSGERVSRLQWDRDHPEQLQEIEVYIYDAQDRVIRDYLAAYLPGYHNAPIQTAINLHHYNHGLHALRQFDASGVLLFEKCTGNHDGHMVDMALEDYEIDESVTATPDYRACFGGLQKTVGEYLLPH